MELLREIAFSIENETYKAADGNGAAAELFGPLFAGTIKVRVPEIADDIKIRATAHAMLEAFGVRDPLSTQGWLHTLVNALVFFEALKVSVPAWITDKQRATAKAEAAIIYAYYTALAKLGDEKKGSGASAEPPSPAP